MQSESVDRRADSTKVAERPGASYLTRVSEPQISLTENAAKRVAWIAAPRVNGLAQGGPGHFLPHVTLSNMEKKKHTLEEFDLTAAAPDLTAAARAPG